MRLEEYISPTLAHVSSITKNKLKGKIPLHPHPRRRRGPLRSAISSPPFQRVLPVAGHVHHSATPPAGALGGRPPPPICHPSPRALWWSDTSTTSRGSWPMRWETRWRPKYKKPTRWAGPSEEKKKAIQNSKYFRRYSFSYPEQRRPGKGRCRGCPM
jgi:hypothetical protein